MVYKLIGKGNTNYDYREKSHVSRIRKSLKAHAGIVSNLDLFLPDKITSKEEIVFNIPIPPDLVYVIEGSKGKEKEIRLVDSEYWKSVLWKDIKH